MLNARLKKLASLLPMIPLTLTLSCGKKINDPQVSSGPERGTENQQGSSLLVLPLTSQVLTSKFDKFGILKTPSELRVIEGSTQNKTVNAYYNLDRNGVWSVKCIYKGTATNMMKLSHCVDSEGSDLGSQERLQSMSIYIYPDNYIQLTNQAGGLKVEAIYKVTW
jgi:hypothetical protein